MKILVAGGTGNLGSRIAADLANRGDDVSVIVHRTRMPEILVRAGVAGISGDLADTATLENACRAQDVVISVAGVLFQPKPERFLHETNVVYVENLLGAAEHCGVRRFLLVSFPHVEGETTPEHPARGTTDCEPPASAHFRTRLEAEKHVLARKGSMETSILRAATVYGDGMKLVEAARWLMRRRLMAVWPEPTWLHLIALPDFLQCVRRVCSLDRVEGIYSLGDDCPLSLQDALDKLAGHWRLPRPRRLSRRVFRFGAAAIEDFCALARLPAPLTREFLSAGMISSVADTSRMKKELLPVLRYPELESGLEILTDLPKITAASN